MTVEETKAVIDEKIDAALAKMHECIVPLKEGIESVLASDIDDSFKGVILRDAIARFEKGIDELVEVMV